MVGFAILGLFFPNPLQNSQFCILNSSILVGEAALEFGDREQEVIFNLLFHVATDVTIDFKAFNEETVSIIVLLKEVFLFSCEFPIVANLSVLNKQGQ